MLLLPTQVWQTAHGNSPELCRRSRPVPQIMIFVFPAFTPSPFFSTASFQVKNLLTFLERFSGDNRVIGIEVLPGDPRVELVWQGFKHNDEGQRAEYRALVNTDLDFKLFTVPLTSRTWFCTLAYIPCTSILKKVFSKVQIKLWKYNTLPLLCDRQLTHQPINNPNLHNIKAYTKLPALVAQSGAHPTGDQVVPIQSQLGPASFFCGEWSWNIFYDLSLPSADSRRAAVCFWQKNVYKYWLTAYRTKHAQEKVRLGKTDHARQDANGFTGP